MPVEIKRAPKREVVVGGEIEAVAATDARGARLTFAAGSTEEGGGLYARVASGDDLSAEVHLSVAEVRELARHLSGWADQKWST